jgi:ectoine hydroxylase
MTLTSGTRYPTRIAEPLPAITRVEPTVWQRGATGPIDDDALDEYEAKGFLVVDDLLASSEVADLRDELRRLSAGPVLEGDERAIVEKASRQVRSIFEVHRISAAVDALTRDPRLVDRARQVLGSEVYIHQSRINYMPGFDGRGFYWHSDFETWHAEDGMPAMRALSVTIALTHNHPFNGSLMVMPGSHREFIPCVGATPEGNYQKSLQEQQFGTPDRDSLTRLVGEHGIDQFTGPAGSALMFDCNTMHGSGSNITPLPRSNLFLVYNSVDNTLVEPFAATKPRPRFAADRDFTPIGAPPR